MNHAYSRTAIAAALSIAFQPAFALPVEDEAAVVVTATRIPTRLNEVIADVTVITREEIEKAGATTLPALLAQQPGLQIVTNGGIGKSTSVFTRGTNAGHTLLLVDGMPLGSATLGQPSLHNLPLAQIERIEILRGPASSLYGSDAIGGVIQVFTKKGEGPMALEAFAGFGSYGTSELSAGVSGASGIVAYSLAASRFKTRGWDATTPAIDANRDADGYKNDAWRGRLSVAPWAGHELGATFLMADSRNRYDSGGVAVDAYNDDLTRVWSVYSRNRLLPAWTSTLRYGGSKDRGENFSPGLSLFQTVQKQWTWQNDVKLPLGTLLLAYEDLRQEVESTTNFRVKERSVRSLVAGWQAKLDNHAWQVSARNDDNSQFGAKTTGSLAYGYALTPQLTARAAIGTAFKAPSFNQLYHPLSFGGQGNPNLVPETAKNREIGLDWFGPTGARLSWTHYDNRIQNLIAGWAPTPVNIARARIRGNSLNGGHQWGAWSAQVSVDLLQPINAANGFRLQRRASEQFKARIGYEPGEWGAGAELLAVGKRYNTGTQTQEMPRYELLNLFGHVRLTKDVRLEGRLDNLFDKGYETARGYPNSGRMLFVGLRYQPK